MADGIFAGEEARRHGLADDDGGWAPGVARIEQTSGAQRNTQRAKVALRGELPADVGRPLAGGHRTIDAPKRHGPVVARQRRDHRGSDRLDVRQRLDALERLRVERPANVVLFVAAVRQRKLHGQHACGREAGVHGQQLREAAQGQARAGQEDDRQRDLRRHESRGRALRFGRHACAGARRPYRSC